MLSTTHTAGNTESRSPTPPIRQTRTPTTFTTTDELGGIRWRIAYHLTFGAAYLTVGIVGQFSELWLPAFIVGGLGVVRMFPAIPLARYLPSAQV